MGIITDEMTLVKYPRRLCFGSHGQTEPLRSDPISSVQYNTQLYKQIQNLIVKINKTASLN